MEGDVKLQEVFLFAAKAGSLEGYLFQRREVEPLANWVDNIARMYRELPPEVKKELAPALVPVLKRTLEYGEKVLEAVLEEKLGRLLLESSAVLGSDKSAG
jgi:hypothetical protein